MKKVENMKGGYVLEFGAFVEKGSGHGYSNFD